MLSARKMYMWVQRVWDHGANCAHMAVAFRGYSAACKGCGATWSCGKALS